MHKRKQKERFTSVHLSSLNFVLKATELFLLCFSLIPNWTSDLVADKDNAPKRLKALGRASKALPGLLPAVLSRT